MARDRHILWRAGVAASRAVGLLLIESRWMRQNLDLLVIIVGASGLALAMVVSMPVYADTVQYQILQGHLSAGASDHAPLALTFRHQSPVEGTSVTAFHGIDGFVRVRVPQIIPLPLKQWDSYIVSRGFRLYKPDEDRKASTTGHQLWVGCYTGVFDHVRIVNGRIPRPFSETAAPGEVMLAVDTAEELGLRVGGTYLLEESLPPRGSTISEPVPIRVSGFWRASRESDPFWTVSPASLSDVLLMPEETFTSYLGQHSIDPIRFANWHFVFDEQAVHPENVPHLRDQIRASRAAVEAVDAQAELTVAPEQALASYVGETAPLLLLLAIFGTPVVGLVLAFVIMMARLISLRRNDEVAVLRSRGLSHGQEIGLSWLEACMVAGLSLILGLGLAPPLAQVISHTRSFLVLSRLPLVPTRLTSQALGFGTVGAAAVALALLVPSIVAPFEGIVRRKQATTRRQRHPLWQRYYLDLLLLLPAAYGLWAMTHSNDLAIRRAGFAGDDPFSNPLLFLVPVLVILAATMVFIRLFPLLIGFAGRWSERPLPVGVTLAMRNLARSSTSPAVSLVFLLSLTLALAGFAAAIAHTLDDQLVQRSYYRVGADIRVLDLGEGIGLNEGQSAENASGTSSLIPTGGFLPLSEYAALSGIRAVTRVGMFDAELPVSLGQQARFVGIDRLDFPHVAYFRRDFARAPLASLMNVLGTGSDRVLANRQFLDRTKLRIGDTVTLRMSVDNDIVALPVIIAGSIDFFPSVDPGTTPSFFVGNLDYVFDVIGAQVPYRLLFRVDPSVRYANLWQVLKNHGARVSAGEDARLIIRQEQTRPERQGVLGLLSTGFAMASILAVIGFLATVEAVLPQRAIELGVLRSLGLSFGQAVLCVVAELAIILSAALAFGSALGIGVSILVIPHLQIGREIAGAPLPMVVHIPWVDFVAAYGAFGLVLVTSVAMVAMRLAQLRVFEAMKLGQELD